MLHIVRRSTSYVSRDGLHVDVVMAEMMNTVDKAVSTDEDLMYKEGWKIVQLESLLTALVDTKLMLIKTGLHHTPSNKSISEEKRHQRRCHRHNCHRHRRKHCHSSNYRSEKEAYTISPDSSLAISGRPYLVETDLNNPNLEEELALTKLRLTGEQSHYITLEMEESRKKTRKKRRKKRKNSVYPKEKVKVTDPSEMSKRARWTIIITAGFLLLTCMLLVGVTLRMAPIIDQIVRTQNEELVKSLNRQEFNESLVWA